MKERIAWIGGDQKRHLYYINKIVERFNVVGGIMQQRGEGFPEPPTGIGMTDLKNWVRHFGVRELAEETYFGEQKPPEIMLLKVDKDSLNDQNSVDYLKTLQPDIVLIFGSSMIREPLLSALPEKTINLHLGLSPRYRGAATLFWPFYFMEPNWAGTTFHYIVHTPDGGDIIHQVRPILHKTDGIHDVACNAVLESTTEALALLEMPSWQKFSQKPETGKNFLESDFRAEHLRVIYGDFDNRMVRAYLEGRITSKEPKLRRQF